MNLSFRALPLVAAAAAAALTLAGCGGDESAEEDATSPVETTVSEDQGGEESTTSTEAEVAEDTSAADTGDEGAGDSVAGDDGDDSSEVALRAVFADYRQALIDRDGVAAVEFVSPNTIEWYDTLLELGLQADAAALESEVPLADAMSVIPMRARFGDELTGFADGRELFIEGVNEGLTGDNLASVELDGFIDAESGSATGIVQGQPLFSFAQGDDGSWTLDLETTTTAIFTQLPEEDFVEGLTGGQGTTRRDLFEIVAQQVYATTWDELSQPIL